VSCNIDIETEIDVYCNVKQAVKWHVLRYVIECNTNKPEYKTVNVSVFRIPNLGGCSQFAILSQLMFDGPQLWRSVNLCSSLYLLTRAHCARCSPSIPLRLASYLLAPAEGRTQLESPDCALRIPVSHDRRRACLLVCSQCSSHPSSKCNSLPIY